MKAVRDIMSTDVQTVEPDAYISEVAGFFVSHKVGGAPILDKVAKVVGFVSQSDIIQFGSTGQDPTCARLNEIPNRRLVTIESSASIEQADNTMLRESVHYLIVEDNGTLLGLLSSFDFVKPAHPEGLTENGADAVFILRARGLSRSAQTLARLSNLRPPGS